MLTVKAPAKINLSLDIVERRKDGYHELSTVMQTVSLCDKITVKPNDTIVVECNHPEAPGGPSNLAYKAAALLKERLGVIKGAFVSIDKYIPVAAGLAGGSADAAAVLQALNQMWQLGLSLPELSELAAEIGSDISFCLTGGTALCLGRGERVQPIAAMPNCYIVLAKPNVSVSTAWAYQQIDARLLPYPNCTERVLAALAAKDLLKLAGVMGNALEKATIPKYPMIQEIKQHMLDLGAVGTMMSGSGPTVFGLTDTERTATNIYQELRKSTEQVYIVQPVG